jgi:hypothetical protein
MDVREIGHEVKRDSGLCQGPVVRSSGRVMNFYIS